MTIKPALSRSISITLSVLLSCGPAFAAGSRQVPSPGGRHGRPAPPIPAGASAIPAGALTIPGIPLPAATDPAVSEALTRIPGAIAQSLKPASVSIILPEAALQGLSPQQKEDAAELAGFMQARLFTWEKISIAIPGTVFDGSDKRVIDVGDLFQAPTDAEVEELGTSEGGKGPRLTKEQRAQIRGEGLFVVPSQRYPGQRHVWRVGRLLQKGRTHITDTRQGHNAAALEQLIFSIPDRIAGEKPLSLRNSLRQTGTGLREALSLVLGLTAEKPRFYPGEIEEEIERRLLARLRESAKDGSIDGRLFDEALWEKARDLLENAASWAESAWRAGLEQVSAAVEAELKAAGVSAADLPQAMADKLDERRNAAFYAALEADKAIDALSPGLGRLLADNARAQVLAAQAQQQNERDIQEFLRLNLEKLKREYPVLSRVPRWLARRQSLLEKKLRGRAQSLVAAWLMTQLRAQGLPQQALRLERELAFLNNEAPALRAQLESQRAPLRSFEHSRRIWSPSRWIIAKQERSGEYYLESKYQTKEVTTQGFFWRLQNVFWRSVFWWNNILYHFLVTNLLNGPLGLKSLLYAKPFHPFWEVNRETGKVERDMDRSRATMISRITSLWETRREILEDFRKDKDYGFLGKDIRRIGLFFYADLLIGLLVPLLVLAGQPVLTAANLALAALLTATSLVWAPALALLHWALSAALYDLDRVNRKSYAIPGGLLPIVDRLAGQVAFGGIGQAVASVFAMAVHAVIAAVHAFAGIARTAAREAWDFAMGGLIAWRGRVPPRDSRIFVRRIAGPGLSAEHFFQVQPALALVALQAALESVALKLYSGALSQVISIPELAYQGVMRTLGAVLGREIAGWTGPAFTRIETDQKSWERALAEATKERNTLYERLLSIPKQERIKLTQADFELTLKKALLLARNFYTAYFSAQAYSPAQIAGFWKDRALSPDDWESLARAELSEVFGGGFLTPLEETDKSLRLEVQSPDLAAYAAGLESGILPEDLKSVVLRGADKPSAPPGASSAVPSAVSLAFKRLLLSR